MDPKPRLEFKLEDTTKHVIMEMSEGNPGALMVLMQMLSLGEFVLILSLDDMNIRGTQVSIGFKDFAKQDWVVFLEAVKKRDPAMVEVINNEGRRGNHPWLAVTYGASREGGRKLL